jgi:hypothetical protein
MAGVMRLASAGGVEGRAVQFNPITVHGHNLSFE